MHPSSGKCVSSCSLDSAWKSLQWKELAQIHWSQLLPKMQNGNRWTCLSFNPMLYQANVVRQACDPQDQKGTAYWVEKKAVRILPMLFTMENPLDMFHFQSKTMKFEEFRCYAKKDTMLDCICCFRMWWIKLPAYFSLIQRMAFCCCCWQYSTLQSLHRIRDPLPCKS